MRNCSFYFISLEYGVIHVGRSSAPYLIPKLNITDGSKKKVGRKGGRSEETTGNRRNKADSSRRIP